MSKVCKKICPNCQYFKGCAVYPKMQGGIYPEYDCFIGKNSSMEEWQAHQKGAA